MKKDRTRRSLPILSLAKAFFSKQLFAFLPYAALLVSRIIGVALICVIIAIRLVSAVVGIVLVRIMIQLRLCMRFPGNAVS